MLKSDSVPLRPVMRAAIRCAAWGTPVGRILISYDAGEKEEIFVCVKITQNPCAETAGYGYDVPSTYYLGVSQ